MIDALELRIPPGVELAPHLRTIGFLEFSPATRMITAEYIRADLRCLGLPVLVHFSSNKHRTVRKLAFARTATLCFADMQRILHAVIDTDCCALEIARVDFAVDIDIPVSWLYRHISVPRKKFSSQFGRFTRNGAVEIETIYLGRRPDCYRIYNKLLESTGQRRVGPRVLTRIERQCSGNGLPQSLRYFGQLQNAAHFNPFEPLRTTLINAEPSRRATRTVIEALARLGAELMVSHIGMQATTRAINRDSKGNAARIRRRLGLVDMPVCGCIPDLGELFRSSAKAQLEGCRTLESARPCEKRD